MLRSCNRSDNSAGTQNGLDGGVARISNEETSIAVKTNTHRLVEKRFRHMAGVVASSFFAAGNLMKIKILLKKKFILG